MERDDKPNEKHQKENPLPCIRQKQYHTDEMPDRRSRKYKIHRLSPKEKQTRNERFHKFLVEERNIQEYSVEEIGHIFKTGLGKNPTLGFLYGEFQNKKPVHAQSRTADPRHTATEMDRQVRDSRHHQPRQHCEHQGPSAPSWRNKTSAHERLSFDYHNGSTDHYGRYEQARGHKDEKVGSKFSNKMEDPSTSNHTEKLYEVCQKFGDEVVTGEHPKHLSDSVVTGWEKQISPEQAEMAKLGIRSTDEMEVYLDKLHAERIPVIQKWMLKVPPISSDVDLDTMYPWEPKPFSSSLSWLQKHVTETCGGVEPKTVGPYNVHHLQKVQAGWTKQYIKGLDRELKNVS